MRKENNENTNKAFYTGPLQIKRKEITQTLQN